MFGVLAFGGDHVAGAQDRDRGKGEGGELVMDVFSGWSSPRSSKCRSGPTFAVEGMGTVVTYAEK